MEKVIGALKNQKSLKENVMVMIDNQTQILNQLGKSNMNDSLGVQSMK